MLHPLLRSQCCVKTLRQLFRSLFVVPAHLLEVVNEGDSFGAYCITYPSLCEIDAYEDPDVLAALSDLLPFRFPSSDTSGAASGTSDHNLNARFSAAVRQLFTFSVIGVQKSIVIIENAENLDATGWSLFNSLQPERHILLVMCTETSGPLKDTVQAVASLPTCFHIALTAFSQEDIDTLVCDHLRVMRMSSSFSALLETVARGNLQSVFITLARLRQVQSPLCSSCLFLLTIPSAHSVV